MSKASSCSAGDSPAKTSHSPEAATESTAPAPACGESLRGSFAWFDRDGSSWRTYQRLLTGEWDLFSETWPRAGIMRNGTAYPLPPSAPLTAVTGSSWSRGEYPTPSATEYGSAQNEGQVPHDRPTRGTPSLSTFARQWPTPCASDSDRGTWAGAQERREQGDKRGIRLCEAVSGWPTPTAMDAHQSGKPRQEASGRHAMSLVHVAVEKPWPTPTASDGTKASGRRGVSESSRAHPGISLTVAACRSGRPLPMICEHGGECRPTLNPLFVEWLMGLPLGWTDVDRASSRSATPSSPRSRR